MLVQHALPTVIHPLIKQLLKTSLNRFVLNIKQLFGMLCPLCFVILIFSPRTTGYPEVSSGSHKDRFKNVWHCLRASYVIKRLWISRPPFLCPFHLLSSFLENNETKSFPCVYWYGWYCHTVVLELITIVSGVPAEYE